jgi:hypothetical protein
MNLLTSKIQYKNFEIGEFVEEKKRSFEESIALIEQFPWEDGIGKIVISLTNPSITFQGNNNDYLKLALFYNGKFVLHYFDQKQTLFTKSFYDIRDTYKYIQAFFDLPNFDYGDFRKENTIFQSNLKHFVSQDFCYEITPKVIKSYLLSTSAINFGLGFFFLFLFTTKTNFPLNVPGIVLLLFLIVLLGGGLNLILFFNYYIYAKNKVLIMSKGNDTFYFGDKGNPAKYNKTEIIRFVTTQVRNNKNPVSGFSLVTIELKNGTDIEIPNILVDDLALANKLDGIPSVIKNRFPLIRSYA